MENIQSRPEQSGASGESARFGILNIFPWLISLACFLSLIPALANVHFWADDYINLKEFQHRFGMPFSQLNAGRPILNLYFESFSFIFGSGSALPYALFNAFIFFFSAFLIIRARYLDYTPMDFFKKLGWVLSALLASGTCWPIFLWITNITHVSAMAFFAGFYYFSKKNSNTTTDKIILSLALLLMVACNPLYSPLTLLIVPKLFGANQDSKFGKSKSLYSQLFSGFSIILPSVLYLIFISFPYTSLNTRYGRPSLKYFLGNLEFYKSQMCDYPFSQYCYLAIFLFATIWVLMRFSDLELSTLYLSSLIILLYVLIQPSQRALNYLIMPILIYSILSFEFIGWLSNKFRQNHFRMLAALLKITLVIFLLLGTSDVRNWALTVGYGRETDSLRVQIAQLIPSNSRLCILLPIDQTANSWVTAGMGGPAGYLLPPINADSVQFTSKMSCGNIANIFNLQILGNLRSGLRARLISN